MQCRFLARRGLFHPVLARNNSVERITAAQKCRATHALVRCPTYKRKRGPPLFPVLSRLNVAVDLIQVGEVVARLHSQDGFQRLQAALIVLAGPFQIRR